MPKGRLSLALIALPLFLAACGDAPEGEGEAGAGQGTIEPVPDATLELQGTGIVIRNVQQAVNDVFPKYYRTMKITSFHNMALRYGFSYQRRNRLFSHPLFAKERPQMLNILYVAV